MKDLTILVVDDEPDLGELVAFEFELVGANVLNASNGKEAFEIVSKRDVHVIVSDIRMPGGDGVELLEHVRSKHPLHPALVFMTGFADISLEDAYAKGAVAMFGKPFNRKELIDTVARSVLPHAERWESAFTPSERHFKIDVGFDSLDAAKTSHRFNFGQGGIFIALTDKLPTVSEPTRFKVSFQQGPVKELEGEGLIRWVRRQDDPATPKGVGIEIKSIVGAHRDDVLRYFSGLSSVAYIPKC